MPVNRLRCPCRAMPRSPQLLFRGAASGVPSSMCRCCRCLYALGVTFEVRLVRHLVLFTGSLTVLSFVLVVLSMVMIVLATLGLTLLLCVTVTWFLGVGALMMEADATIVPRTTVPTLRLVLRRKLTVVKLKVRKFAC